MTNARLLESKMVLHGDTLMILATELNLSRQTMGKKLQGKAQFIQREIHFFIKRYELTAEEVLQIFFCEETI